MTSAQNLVYGQDYLCYIGKECVGTGTFINDPYIGDSFSRLIVHPKRGIEEEIIVPEWVLRLDTDC